MARVIKFEGRSISVPDDATDDEIAGIIESSAAPAPNPDGLDKYRADPNAPEMTQEQMQQMMEQLRSQSDTGEIKRARAESPNLAATIDVLGGMGSMTRGALNLLPGDPGNTLMGDPKYMDKESGAYLAGSLLDPAAYATGAEIASIPALTAAKGAPLIEKIWKGATVGGTTGATIGGLSNEGDRTSGTTVGGIVGSLFGGAFPLSSAVLGRTVDMVRGKMPDVRVARMLNEAAGDTRPLVRSALNTTDDVTVGQAVGKGATAELAGIQGFVDDTVGDPALQMARRQEEARRALLAANTPDLATAEAARTAGTGPLYGKAFADDVARRQADEAAAEVARAAQESKIALNVGGGSNRTAARGPAIPPVLRKLTDNPVIQAAASQAKILARSGVEINGQPLDDATIALIQKNPMASLEGLHMMKLAIDNQFKNRTAATGLQNFTDGALNATKKKLMEGVKDVSPGYEKARATFQALSAPVNQSKVMGELSKTLAKPGNVGERAQPFLNAMEDSTKLIKRADQNPRFGALSDILTPQQMGAASKVAGELSRDKALTEASRAGKAKAEDIIKNNLLIARLPHVMSAKVTLLNDALNFVGNKLNAKTLNRLNEVMYNPQLAAKVIETLPAAEQNIILKAMSNPAVIGRGVGMMTGAEQQ